jgi:hypothetical protein
MILTFFGGTQHQNNEYVQRYPHQPIYIRPNTILNYFPFLVRHQREINPATYFEDAKTPHRDAFVSPEDRDEEAGSSNREGYHKQASWGYMRVVGHDVFVQQRSEHHGAHQDGKYETEWEIWEILG